MASLLYDHDIEAEKIKRRRAVSEALLAQSMQPMGGTESVGGIAVRRSPLEGLAKVAQAYMAQKGIEKSDTEAKGLGNRVREDVAAAIGDYTKAVSSRPGSSEPIIDETANGGEGEVATIDAPGYSPSAEDKRLAAFKLMGTTGGDPRDTAKMIVANALKGETGFAKVDPKDYTPASVAKFGQTGNHADLVPVRKMDFVNLGGRSQAVDPYSTAPGASLTHTPAPQGDPEIVRELKAAGLQPGTPAWEKAMAARIARQTTHPAAVQVQFGQEKAESAAVGKGFGEQYIEVQKSGLAANTKLANLQRMQGLLEGVNTGRLTPLGTEIAALATSLGFNVDPKLGNKQAVDALSKEMALALRNPAGGAGMPGALSDQDRRFLESMVAGLGKDPQANKLIIDGMMGLAKRDQEVAQLARDYRQKNGQLDEGFYNQLAAFSKANPLFSQKTGTSGALTKNADGTFTYTPGAQ